MHESIIIIRRSLLFSFLFELSKVFHCLLETLFRSFTFDELYLVFNFLMNIGLFINYFELIRNLFILHNKAIKFFKFFTLKVACLVIIIKQFLDIVLPNFFFLFSLLDCFLELSHIIVLNSYNHWLSFKLCIPPVC